MQHFSVTITKPFLNHIFNTTLLFL